MRPDIFENDITVEPGAQKDNLVSFKDGTGKKLSDSSLKIIDVNKAMEKVPEMENHSQNFDIHVTPEEKESWNLRPGVNSHVMNADIHVSPIDRASWDAKETEDGAQSKANVVMTALNRHRTNLDIHITPDERKRWSDSYNKAEINAIIAQLEFNIDWKESVNSFSDIEKTYPEPYDGWTVNVLDTDVTYRYDGDKWIAISANTIPNATKDVDGKMSKEDKIKMDGIEDHANHYVHPEDKYTRHVTDQQIIFWTNKASVSPVNYTVNGLMSADDKKKLDGIEDYATHYEHPENHPAAMIQLDETHQFVTNEQINSWTSKASNTIVTRFTKGLMEAADKVKLDNIEERANRYVHPDAHPAKMIAESTEQMFCSVSDKKLWNEKFGPDNILRGSGIFNGVEGARIKHEINDPSLSYTVIVTPTSGDDMDHIGTVFVRKQATEAYVVVSGGNISDTFDYIIIKG